MANDDDDNTGTVIAVGAIGGGAVLLWYLLRGRDRGLGGGGGSDGGQGSPAVAAPAEASPTPAGPPCNVFMRGTAIELNGAASDLTTAVATCRASGSAHLRATGLTTHGRVVEVARALNAAGVAILAHGNIADSVRDALMRAA